MTSPIRAMRGARDRAKGRTVSGTVYDRPTLFAEQLPGGAIQFGRFYSGRAPLKTGETEFVWCGDPECPVRPSHMHPRSTP